MVCKPDSAFALLYLRTHLNTPSITVTVTPVVVSQVVAFLRGRSCFQCFAIGATGGPVCMFRNLRMVLLLDVLRRHGRHTQCMHSTVRTGYILAAAAKLLVSLSLRAGIEARTCNWMNLLWDAHSQGQVHLLAL